MSEDRREAQLYVEKSTAGQSQMQNAVAGPSNIQLSSSMLKHMDVDCFEELFDWLSLADLRSLRQSCKRLKQVVDYFIKTRYPAVKIGHGKFHLDSELKYDQLQQMNSTKVRIIKHIIIKGYNLNLNRNKIEVLEEIWPQLEKLTIVADFEADLYEQILMLCTNLKYLSVRQYLNSGFDDSIDGNGWFRRRYPTIDHIRLCGGLEMPEGLPDWRTFFEFNPNIQTLSASMIQLEEMSSSFLGSNIKIDLLDLEVDGRYISSLLNELYGQGFFKRLHLYIYAIDQHNWPSIKWLCGLEKLSLHCNAASQPALPPLPNLKALYFRTDFNSRSYYNLDDIAKSLINVEHVYFASATPKQIISFIRYAPKVKGIKVRKLSRGLYFKNGIINLSALNEERKGLAGAHKIKIYVSEEAFLVTKMAAISYWKTGLEEFNLVTLKRSAAVKWNIETTDDDD